MSGRWRWSCGAYAGDHIDAALREFLDAAGRAGPDLLVWAGHDRLMDVAPPPLRRAEAPRRVAVLACESERYFGPVLQRLGAQPVALTRTFMAPEAYLLEALAEATAQGKLDDVSALRARLIRAYAKYQRISERAAASVFSRLPAPRK